MAELNACVSFPLQLAERRKALPLDNKYRELLTDAHIELTNALFDFGRVSSTYNMVCVNGAWARAWKLFHESALPQPSPPTAGAGEAALERIAA